MNSVKQMLFSQFGDIMDSAGIAGDIQNQVLDFLNFKMQIEPATPEVNPSAPTEPIRTEPKEPMHFANPFLQPESRVRPPRGFRMENGRRIAVEPAPIEGMDNFRQQLQEQFGNLARQADYAEGQCNYLGRIAESLEGTLAFLKDTWYADHDMKRTAYEKAAKDNPSLLLRPTSMDSLKEQASLETLGLVRTVAQRLCGDRDDHKSHLGMIANVIGSIKADIEARRYSRTGLSGTRRDSNKSWDA